MHPSQASPGEETIAERAYRFWEIEGRPEGQEVDHWLRAERELAGEQPANPREETSPLEDEDSAASPGPG
jgi:hypothetical protein